MLLLRDKVFLFEAMLAPEIFIPNVSLSYAISLLLDSVGFTNYVFLRAADEKDAVIPFFYISPNKTVAEILGEIAVSTQSAMFFDEYNNLVVMSKEYMLPEKGVRPVTSTIRGNKDSDGNLENIVSISQSDMEQLYETMRNREAKYKKKWIENKNTILQQKEE